MGNELCLLQPARWVQVIPLQDGSQCNSKILEVSECFVFAYHDPVPISYYSRIKQEVGPDGHGSPADFCNHR